MPNFVSDSNLQNYSTQATAKYKTIFATKAEIGSLKVIIDPSDFATADHTLSYVYLGTTTASYTHGDIYYWDGTGWASAGAYTSTPLDTTLTLQGYAADSKSTGDAVTASFKMVAELYDTTRVYVPGDYCIYGAAITNRKLYVCIQQTAGTWNSARWREATIGDDLVSIYAKQRGHYRLMIVGYADNFTPYSSDSGISQSAPFILQGSGCANGEGKIDTGSYCQLKEKRGNTVVVNQAAKAINSTNWSAEGGVTATFTNGEAVFTSETRNNGVKCNTGIPTISGHKYLLYFEGYAEAALALRMYYGSGGGVAVFNAVLSTSIAHYSGISTAISNGTTGNLYIFPIENEGLNTEIHIKNPLVIDLTLWFGSNDKIPTHLLNHPEDFFRYYQGDLSYNVGTLTDCNGRYLKAKGRNVWDEEWEEGTYDVNTGAKYSSSSNIRCKNLIRIIPNTTYYKYCGSAGAAYWMIWYDADGNYLSYTGRSPGFAFTTPNNACYMAFYFETSYGTTYKNDTTISLYYEGESGYDQYYPYEELANIDTGDEPLLAFDYKTPDGVVHKETGKVDLGTLTYGYVAQSDVFYPASMPSDFGGTRNARCSAYTIQPSTTSADSIPDKAIEIRDASTVYLRNNAYTDPAAFKTAMSGVYLEYELADSAKTTEQGTPFPENVAIDDFGTMSFDCPNGVPQGNLIFYPVDYKAEIDTLHNITDGDMHKIALKGDNLAPTDPDTIKGVVDYTTEVKEACDGTLRQLLAFKKEIDFNTTAVIDLSTKNWSASTAIQNQYYCIIQDLKTGYASSEKAPLLCSRYATGGVGANRIADKEVGTGTSGGESNTMVAITDSAYSTLEAFKASLKGVLLAYEKATT